VPVELLADLFQGVLALTADSRTANGSPERRPTHSCTVENDDLTWRHRAGGETGGILDRARRVYRLHLANPIILCVRDEQIP
jgi:hypothetical protein